MNILACVGLHSTITDHDKFTTKEWFGKDCLMYHVNLLFSLYSTPQQSDTTFTACIVDSFSILLIECC